MYGGCFVCKGEVEFEVELHGESDGREESKNPRKSCSIFSLCLALWLTTTPSGQTRSKILSRWIHKLSVRSSLVAMEEVGEVGASG